MELMSIYQSIWTVVVLVIFVGIAIWAWSGKNKTAFDKAARIPLDDDNFDEELKVQKPEKQEKNNG